MSEVVPNTVRDAVLGKLLALPENKTCADCGSRNPKWCSATFAIYLCLECAGMHREMGVHNSFVRSLNLDTWYPEQLSRMAIGGNSRAASFFRSRQAGSLKGRARYSSKAAEAYRRALDKAVADHPLDLTAFVSTGGTSSQASQHDLLSAEPELDWEDSIPVQSNFPADSIAIVAPQPTSTPPPRTASASASHTLTYKGKESTSPVAKKGVRNVATDFFDDFDESSSEEEVAPPPSRTSTTTSTSGSTEAMRQGFSRLNMNGNGNGNGSTTKSASANVSGSGGGVAKKKDVAHSHTLWDDEDEPVASASKSSLFSNGYGGSGYGDSYGGGSRSTYGGGYSSSSSSSNYGYGNRPSSSTSKAQTSSSSFFEDDWETPQTTGRSHNTAGRTRTSDTTQAPSSAKDKFADSTAISSDQFFGRSAANNPSSFSSSSSSSTASSSRFAGATSISSAQYYNRDESAMAARRMQSHGQDDEFDFEDLLGGVDVEAAKDKMLEVGSKLSSMAKDWMDDWGGF